MPVGQLGAAGRRVHGEDIELVVIPGPGAQPLDADLQDCVQAVREDGPPGMGNHTVHGEGTAADTTDKAHGKRRGIFVGVVISVFVLAMLTVVLGFVLGGRDSFFSTSYMIYTKTVVVTGPTTTMSDIFHSPTETRSYLPSSITATTRAITSRPAEATSLAT